MLQLAKHMTSWIDCSFDSLAKWDKGAWQKHFLQAMNEAFCNFLTLNPNTRPTILLEKLQSSKCHWEDLYDEEHGTDIGYTNMQVMMPIDHGHKYGAAYHVNDAIIIYQCLISLSVNTAEYLLLLYASCSFFCQEEDIKKNYEGMLPNKPTLISKNHEHAYLDYVDWALGKLSVRRYFPVSTYVLQDERYGPILNAAFCSEVFPP